MQGLSESVVGVMMGGAGLVGILGSAAYPFLRRCLGLPRSGMVAMTLQISCLSACIVSVWLPGSPFEFYSDRVNSNDCINASVITLANETLGE